MYLFELESSLDIWDISRMPRLKSEWEGIANLHGQKSEYRWQWVKNWGHFCNLLKYRRHGFKNKIFALSQNLAYFLAQNRKYLLNHFDFINIITYVLGAPSWLLFSKKLLKSWIIKSWLYLCFSEHSSYFYHMLAFLIAGTTAISAALVAERTSLLIWKMKSNLRDTRRKKKKHLCH